MRDELHQKERCMLCSTIHCIYRFSFSGIGTGFSPSSAFCVTWNQGSSFCSCDGTREGSILVLHMTPHAVLCAAEVQARGCGGWVDSGQLSWSEPEGAFRAPQIAACDIQNGRMYTPSVELRAGTFGYDTEGTRGAAGRQEALDGGRPPDAAAAPPLSSCI